MLWEGLGLHRFPEATARRLLKCAEASFVLADSRGVWQRCRHFTFVYRGHRLLSVGLNSPKTHPRSLMYRYRGRSGEDISGFVGTHSEISAVMRLDRPSCRGLVLINTRINRRGFLDLSRPCSGCLDMIRSTGFREVYYTTRDGIFDSLEF